MPGEARDVCLQTANSTSDARDVPWLLNGLRSLCPTTLLVARAALGAQRPQQAVAGRQSNGCFNAAASPCLGLAHPLAPPSSAPGLAGSQAPGWWDPGAGAEAPIWQGGLRALPRGSLRSGLSRRQPPQPVRSCRASAGAGGGIRHGGDSRVPPSTRAGFGCCACFCEGSKGKVSTRAWEWAAGHRATPPAQHGFSFFQVHSFLVSETSGASPVP